MENPAIGDQAADELMSKFIEFHFKMAMWNANILKSEFNVNGRGEPELSLRRFMILYVARMKKEVTITELEHVMSISKSSLSITISKLVEDGLLVKKTPKAGQDGRKVYITISKKGIKSLSAAQNKLTDIFSQFYNSLNENQKKNLIIGIESLSGIFSA